MDPLLADCFVLVIEDDFYLADDARQALEDAGATVLGPCGSAAEAIDLLGKDTPDCAVVDVNLGHGPTFESAKALKARAIPFILATGYDASIIPPEFADTLCLQKPTNAGKLTQAVARLCRAAKGAG